MKRIRVAAEGLAAAAEEAGAVVRAGGVIIFPAERLYGIGADAKNAEAVRRVYELKGRPAKTPLPVMVSDREEAEKWVEANGPARALMGRFWPGALTLVLPERSGHEPELSGHEPERPGLAPERSGLAPEVSAGSGRIGIRVPGNELARLIARAAGGPVTATSANPSGGGECWDVDELAPELSGRVDLLVDAGRLDGPPGSTVALVLDIKVKILREGAVGREEVRGALAGWELE